MARREKSNKSVLRRLLSDPWRKLASLILAIGLWFFLDSQVTDAQKMTLRLELIDIDTPAESGQDPTVDVRVPTTDYSLIDFEDISGNRRGLVELRFEGSKHLMRRIRDERPRFYVRPTSVDLRGSQPTFQIDISKIEPYNRDFDRLLVAMEPDVVTVRLERNATSPRLFPKIDHLEITGLDQDSDLRTRLKYEDVSFEPSGGIQLTGTQRNIEAAQNAEKLFTVDLSAFIDPQDAIKVPLRLHPEIVATGVRMLQRDVAAAVFPVAPRFKEFTLKNVPVILHAERAGRPATAELLVEPDHVDVVIRASGALEVELTATTDPQQQANWVTENVFVLASLRGSALPQDIATPVLKFVETRWDTKDVQVDQIQSITVKPKPQ